MQEERGISRRYRGLCAGSQAQGLHVLPRPSVGALNVSTTRTNVCDVSQLDGQAESCIFTPFLLAGLLGAFHQSQCGRRLMECCGCLPGDLPVIWPLAESSSAERIYAKCGKTLRTAIQRRGSCIHTCRRYAERVGRKSKSVAVRNGSGRVDAGGPGLVHRCAPDVG